MNVLLSAVIDVVELAFSIYTIIVVARALVSWVNPDPYNQIVRFLHSATDPVLYRMRRTLPFLQMGGFDFSPIALIFILSFMRKLIVGLLIGMIH